MKQYLRPLGRAALVVLSALVGMFARNHLTLAVPILAVAAGLQFWLERREQAKAQAPRELFVALLADLLESYRVRHAGDPLSPHFGLWIRNGSANFQFHAGDSQMARRMEAQREHLRDPECAIWQAFEEKRLRFQVGTSNPPGGMERRDWEWRLGLPVFHVTDLGRVTAVITVDGVGGVSEPERITESAFYGDLEFAMHIIRPVASVFEAYV